MGTLKLSDFWLSQVPTKTKAGKTMIAEDQLEVVRLVVGSDPNKDQGTSDDGATVNLKLSNS